MRPVVSTVTCTMIGTVDARRRAIARRAPLIAALRLEQVVDGLDEQHVDAAGDAARRPGLVVVAERRRKAIWPSDGSRVPGPIEPITKRGRSGVEKSAATSRASARRLLG